MSSLRVVSVAIVCASLLVACSKPAGGSASASAAAPTAAAAPSGDAEISMSDLPRTRPGAWVMADITDGKTDPNPTRLCVVNQTFDIGKLRKMCSKFVFHRTLTGLTIDSVCGTDKASATMHGTVTGDFQSDYTTDMKMTMAIPGQPVREIDTAMHYKYAGDCTPGELAEAKQDAAIAQKAMDNPAGE